MARVVAVLYVQVYVRNNSSHMYKSDIVICFYYVTDLFVITASPKMETHDSTTFYNP